MQTLSHVREPEVPLHIALTAMWRRPWSAFIERWSWKTAVFSVLLRAGIFFLSNLKSGEHHAIDAMLIEAAFSFFASGFLGALTQDLRTARPRWAVGLIIWIALPVLTMSAEYGVHRIGGTPHVRVGLLASFAFAAIASGFTSFAMQRGTLLAGKAATSIFTDLRQMPAIMLDFLLAGPRAVARLVS